MTAHLGGTWALRLAVPAGGWCDLAGVHLAGGDTPLWLWVAVSGLGVAAAAWPGSLVPLLALGSMLAAWLAVPDGTPSGWVLLGAGGVIVSHVAALVLGSRPPGAVVPAALVHLWARRSSLLWLSSGALWAAARVTAAPAGTAATSVRVGALALLGAGALWLSLTLGNTREGR